MKHWIALTKVACIFFFCLTSSAEVLFEGYYKITLSGEHIGYIIQKYDLDSAAKTFISTSYTFTKTAEGTSAESLVAKSNSKLEPVSYQYSHLEGKKTKAIDAIVVKNKLVLKVIENGKKPTATEIGINDKIFFSTFLPQLMLKNPKGIAVGNKFSYDAVAEEDGSIKKGEVYVKEQVKEQGIATFRTLNTYKIGTPEQEEFVNWIDIKGEPIKTMVEKIHLSAELMSDPKLAYKDLPFNEGSIKMIFGNVPQGKTNMLHKK